MSKLGDTDRPFWRIGIYKRLGRGKAVEGTKRVQGTYMHTGSDLVISFTGQS